MSRENTMRTLTLKNGLAFQLVTRGKHFLGLGKITAGKVALRSGRRPMSAEIRSPDARKLCNYRIESEEVTDTGFRLTLAADVAQGDVMDWMVPRSGTATTRPTGPYRPRPLTIRASRSRSRPSRARSAAARTPASGISTATGAA
jgi:hypothetical protein